MEQMKYNADFLLGQVCMGFVLETHFTPKGAFSKASLYNCTLT